MLVFLTYLVELLDQESSSWRDDTVLLFDCAKYHVGLDIKNYMRKLELPVIYSGPYSYDAAPVEKVFGHLKFG